MTRTLFASIATLLLSCSAAHAQHNAHRHRDALDHAPAPSEAGQAAFAALREAVSLLESDPSTDWSKVDIDRLREHLLDMDAVMMHASARIEERGNDIMITATGSGRALQAIQRMIPAHAAMMDGHRGWRSRTETRKDGAVWTLTAPSAAERTRIRALGLFGLLTLGSHHGPHHLAMATGIPIQEH